MGTDLLFSDRERRQAKALEIKALDDVLSFPRLAYWNYDACEYHKDLGPQVDCQYQLCGGDLFSHQRVGLTWLYAVQKGLLADDTGIGKTLQILALLALLKEKHELRRRAVIVPTSPATKQWGKEIARWVPGIRSLVVNSRMPKAKREQAYATSWDCLVIGDRLLLSDIEFLEKIAPFDVVVSDDVDPLLKPDNETHKTFMRLAEGAKYSFTVNATVIQTDLAQLHSAYKPAGGYDIFGSLENFEARYRKTEYVKRFDERTGKTTRRREKSGWKHVDEMRAKMAPYILKRKATELTDVRMPMVMPPTIEWLEMSQAQRIRYQELQEGVMRLIRDEGEHVKHVTALAKFTYGQQICAGLPALGEPDGPGASPKLDRLFYLLNTVWADRKTIVYVKNVGMVKAAIARAHSFGYDCALIWGQKQNDKQREEQKEKFWFDPNCRFLIGTTALERGHNLQISNNVCAIDQQLNPARMYQLLGRSKRAGSSHDRVWMTSFMMTETQEEKYNDIQRERQAVADVMFGEQNELFEALPPLRLLQLMTP